MRKLFASFIALLLFGASAMAQTVQVTGRVLDSAGTGVANATIRERGGRAGTSASSDGTFKITVRQAATLIISAVGFNQQEVAASSNVTVSLTRDASAGNLNEVVVTALGIRRSARSTGYATSTVSSAELTQARATNVANGLTGKVAGLQINTVNNGVGADVRIVLRGERSITGNNQALIVIDNVPVSASYLNSLNPDDIENVSVLKGANAAALYGSDASNGVLMVTTKRGVRAKPSISFTHSTTLEKISFFPELNTRFGAASTEPDSLSAYTGFYGRIPYENQMYGPEYNGRPVALGYAKRFYRADGSAYDSTQTISYDYKNPTGKFFQQGRTLQNGVSYQSGDQNGSFFFSGQFNNTTGTVPDDKANRYSVRVGATRNYNKFSSSFSVGYTRFETNTAGLDYNQQRPVYWNVLNTPGEVPIKDYEDPNHPFANENNWYNAYYPNPYWQIYNSRIKTNQDDILGSLELNYKATSWLNFTYRLGATARNFQEKDTRGGVTFSQYEISDPLGAGGTASGAPNGIKPVVFDQLTQRFILQSDFLINLEHKFFNDDFGVRLLLGNSINKSNIRNLQSGNNQLEIPGLYNVSNVVGIPTVSEGLTRQGRIGAFGSLQLSYKNFLFVEVTGRNDWDSRLPKQNRSFFYPGVNGSFVFTDAIKSLKDISWLTIGRLTASYTKVGSLGSIFPYQLANTFSQSNGFPYNSLTSFTLDNLLANQNLKPEFTNSQEYSLNFGLLRNRLNFGITYYNQVITNQTIGIGISSSTGFTSAAQNVGKVTNSGWEFEARLTPLVNLGSVKFNINGNLALSKSYVNYIDPKVSSVTIGGFTSGAIYTLEKQPIRVLQVTDYLRDSLGRVIVSPTTGRPSIAPGLVNVGRSTPNVILGLNPSFEYKGLTLSILGEYRGGYTVYNLIGNAMAFTGVSAVTTATGRQRFVYPNSVVLQNGKYVPNTNIVVDNASNGSSFWTSGTSFRGAGTNFITSGAFWKVREVSLNYAIPVRGSVARVIKRASLGLVARNLFTFLPKDNIYADPEYSSVNSTGPTGVNNQGTSGNAQGISNENLSPPTRIFGATLNVTF